MLPPPFLILPQAEINFNYFPSLAHDECQDKEALTLNKYVALGLCLVEQRTRAACGAWPGAAPAQVWLESITQCSLQGWQGWIHSREWLWRHPWHHFWEQPCLSTELELGGSDRAMSSHALLGQGQVGAKGSLEKLLVLPGEHSHLVCNGTAAGASKSPVKVGLYSFGSHSS